MQVDRVRRRDTAKRTTPGALGDDDHLAGRVDFGSLFPGVSALAHCFALQWSLFESHFHLYLGEFAVMASATSHPRPGHFFSALS